MQQQQQHHLQDHSMEHASTVSGNQPLHTFISSFGQSTSNSEEANQSIWSGFNTFFSNVAHNPFPQSIPNLAKNVSEYFSNYQLFSSLNTQAAANPPQGTAQIQGPTPGIKYESLIDGSYKPPSMSPPRMQIRVLGVPQSGAKSRVETQTKLCLQLVTDDGDKAQHWSHLKLPEHMVAKDKLKRQQQIIMNTDNNGTVTSVNGLDDSYTQINADSMLFLSARVICASDPSRKVLTCLGCIQRERKRSQRRKESKIKSDNNDGDKRLEDEQSLALEEQKILLFNCSEIVDFSSGDTILPTRITCYCRHHNERLGFCIYFEMQDHTGKPVASGISPPIMITDDHKSSKLKAGRKRLRTDDVDTPIKTHAILAANSFEFGTNTPSPIGISPIRSKDIQKNTSNDAASAIASSSNSNSSLPFNNSFIDTPFNSDATQSIPQHHVPHIPHNNERPSATDGTLQGKHISLVKQEVTPMDMDHPLLHSIITAATKTSRSPNENDGDTKLQLQEHPQQQSPTACLGKGVMVEHQPQMQRMIPNEGPTGGGIEVTILGTGFRPGLTCMFGDVAATNSHYWSPNTLVCVLPPAIEPGAVVVSFKEFNSPSQQDQTMFTYCNEGDRALMELALQVVGLKMTGKVEDARNIAMRIVDGNGNHVIASNPRHQQHQQHQQQHSLTPSSAVAPTSLMPPLPSTSTSTSTAATATTTATASSISNPSIIPSLLSTQQQLSLTWRSLPSVEAIRQLLDDRASGQNKLCFDWPMMQMLDSPGPWSD
ncbi:hypothetical protein BCR42DRAFT_489934 [Absidia repens]|uniref:IPT/TIG domain-containing protein n=1 Tax=Absidia repens TaxID=90262 RepID=A0A1X2IMV6_9FUNG|nr:hypothetical protein BCR42DRAFT_489934 [Absidia repens]